ncbi:Glutamate decarboxylase 2 [Ceratocystis platani]|uniref:Glutamate decarboxylase 2 n=1 Tax=Ceratocystis fimbriata f. sp. platani TaxID=88771 RepID=A0A0F8AXA5_CERFI|nr:Glutamate decarboxylase 2 [Ceratocystis platani]
MAASKNLQSQLHRAAEVDELLEAVKGLVIPFVAAADAAASDRATGDIPAGGPNVLVDQLKPQELIEKLALQLPLEGKGKDGVLGLVRSVLKYSVNTWDQGFLDKLYASNNAVGVVADLVLSILNTNLHVYQVSPALTVIEKATATALARLFGFTGPRAGGITCQGGSSSNLTSLVIARSTLFPEIKAAGNGAYNFVVFTSAHGHYSVAKAALTCGIGSRNVWDVPVDSEGRMQPAELRRLVIKAQDEGFMPFYINATAGTTVMGSYDPFHELADIAQEFGLWLHIDGSWGGSVAFSSSQRHKLAGAERANSLTVNPHKMLGVPVTCSYLLTSDMAIFHRANTLPAGYLFHGPADADSDEPAEVWDLADLTLQCGRRGDAFKLALAWVYYGSEGFEAMIDHAFDAAATLARTVCFYYAPGGQLAEDNAENTRRTREMTALLIQRGFMIDYAPGPKGSFFRVVVNVQTLMTTVDGLISALQAVGRQVVV